MKLSEHTARARHKSRLFPEDDPDNDGGLIPPIQIQSTGSPISIIDGVVDNLLFVVTFALLGYIIGKDPRNAIESSINGD